MNGHAPDTDEEEAASLASSDSLQDQGYAASEGMGEGEEPAGSPADGGLSRGPGGGQVQDPPGDGSSDSDEGCATWGSRHR